MRSFEAAPPQRAHIGLQGGGFFGAHGCETGGEQPIDFFFFDRARRASATVDERSATSGAWVSGTPRENSKRGTAPDAKAEKSAFDFAAAGGNVLGDDEQAGMWAGGDLMLAPLRAGVQFGLLVPRLVEEDVGGRFIACADLPASPRVEEISLDRQKTIKTDREKQADERPYPFANSQADRGERGWG